ncbi:hypothetical protein CDL15_Pgr028822 [Punica granatum]|uniref:Uncharacterized protein n=1 Tax=Punica granatum TaxID=22663 RepID=A0A218XHA1_PUNGR|nr:hypothetical protein CDL15_Pgr028822 [Punica granatum]
MDPNVTRIDLNDRNLVRKVLCDMARLGFVLRRFPAPREHDVSREADMSLSGRRCPMGFHAHRNGVVSSLLCPWGGFHRCFAPGVTACLICRKSALLLGQLLVALPGAGFIAGAIVVCWGCPGRAMRDSSSGVERLRIPRGRKSESAIVLAFVVPVILTSLVSHGITSDL